MFKTQAEVWKHLIDGGRVAAYFYNKGEFVHLVNGTLVNQHGQTRDFSFLCPEQWSIAEKPKPPRKLYAYLTNMNTIVFSPTEAKSTGHFMDVNERAPMFDIEYKD